MTARAPVVVVAGGDRGIGRAIAGVLLDGGARVLVTAPSEAAAERYYLEADPETVPRLRVAVGDPADPATGTRIAALAARDFGGIDHVVSAIAPGLDGPLPALQGGEIRGALERAVLAPGVLILSLLRHLTGGAAVRRVVILVQAPRDPADAAWLGRAFAESLVERLRRTPPSGIECYALRVASFETGGAEAGRAVARLLAEGAAAGVVDGAAAP